MHSGHVAGLRAASIAVTMMVLGGCPAEDPAPEGWTVAVELETDRGALLSAWGPEPDDIWAVGGQPGEVDAGGRATLLHFDGDDWSDAALGGDLDANTPMLNWIYGVDGTLVTVGEGGVILRSAAGDGGDWQVEASPTDLPLWGVWGAAADDLWAVGGDATPGTGNPVLLHRDAGGWARVDVPTLDRDCDALFKVWGAGDRVFAVGDAGVILGRDPDTGVWAQVSSGTTSDLISLWGTGPDDMVAVGGRSNGTLLRWNGERWSGGTLGGAPGLNGVWVDAGGRAHVVGTRGYAAHVEAGGAEPIELDSGAVPLVLHAVFGFGEGDEKVAVGGTLDRSPPLEGVLISAGL